MGWKPVSPVDGDLKTYAYARLWIPDLKSGMTILLRYRLTNKYRLLQIFYPRPKGLDDKDFYE